MIQKVQVGKGITSDPSFGPKTRDVEEFLDSRIFTVSTCGSSSTQTSQLWWSGNIDTSDVLKHIAWVPGIKEAMFYVSETVYFDNGTWLDIGRVSSAVSSSLGVWHAVAGGNWLRANSLKYQAKQRHKNVMTVTDADEKDTKTLHRRVMTYLNCARAIILHRSTHEKRKVICGRCIT